MRVKHLAAALLAVAVVAYAKTGEASDTIKLKLPAQPAGDVYDLKATEADLRTETLDTRRYYGGGYGGRGGFYGGGYRGGYYGGYRGGFYGGGYRGGYYGGYGGYRGGYYGGYGGYRAFYPRYYGYSYLPSYYTYSGFAPGYYSYAYTYPCALDTAPPALTVRVGPSYSLRPAPIVPGRTTPVLPPPREEKNPGTFPYDGGPKDGVPMPPGDEGKTSQPRKPAIVEDILVSTAPMDVSGKGKWAYPAYGETPRRASKSATGFQLMVYGRTAK